MPAKSANSRDLRKGFNRNEPCAVSCLTAGNCWQPAPRSALVNSLVSWPTIEASAKIVLALASGKRATLPFSWLSQTVSPSQITSNSGAITNIGMTLSPDISTAGARILFGVTSEELSRMCCGNFRNNERNSSFSSSSRNFAVSKSRTFIASKSSFTGASVNSRANSLLI